MAANIYVNYVDDINFVQLEKNGAFIHVLFSSDGVALIPALDVAAVAFPKYKRQNGNTRSPVAVGAFASYYVTIRTLQAFSKGQRTLREIYFSQQQPCQKFPTNMELCDYNDLQNLQNDRASKGSTFGKDGFASIKDSKQQVQTIGKMMEILKQCNKKRGLKETITVSIDEYNKLLQEVQYYRQYFAKTAEIRQQLGIVFDANNNAKAV